MILQKKSLMVRLSIMLSVLLIFQAAAIFGQEKSITVRMVPSSVDEFLTLRASLADTPEGGAAMFLLTMLAMENTPDTALQMMTAMLDRSLLSSGGVYKGYAPSPSVMFHIQRFTQSGKWSYVPKAYIDGTAPESGYSYTLPFTFIFLRNPYSGDESTGRVKVFVNTYGVSPRPITLKVNDKGIWKPSEVSSLFLDVVKPPSDNTDDL